MMVPWLSFIAALTGFGLLSLTMQRHAGAWSGYGGTMWQRRSGTILVLAGAASLVGSCAVALHDNRQLGVIYWSAYLMAAALLVTGMHAYAERWAVRMVVLVSVMLCGSIAIAALP